ncbi:MAG TPA: hypothetical protein VH520_02915 [Streptosporangiaceae bacterium]
MAGGVMPQLGGPGWPGSGGPAAHDSGVAETCPDLLGSDLAHLFDYCRALSLPDADAARTARSVLDSAREPLPDPERLRAWLFGLARSLALAVRPSGGEEFSYLPCALTGGSSQTDTGVLRAFRALSDRDREILDLVYRHGIRPADLPAVLILPAEEVYRCLITAEAEFVSLAAGPDSGPGADLDDIGALPLAALPAAEGGKRQWQSRPALRLNGAGRRLNGAARWLDGAGLRRMVARRRVQFAAAVIPVAAILGGVVLFAVPGHVAASRGTGVVPGIDARPGTGAPGSPQVSPSSPSPNRSAPGQPVAAPTGMPEPASSSSSPATTGLTGGGSPLPCSPGTHVNFRWHYTASASPGGWSGTTSSSCPGSVTMGPQAIGGNLQVTPGTTLQAGYDFTLPGNTKSLTVTVSAAKVAFTVSCVSNAAPSAPKLKVHLPSQTYQVTGSQWYPSRNQSSPLVYQGSVVVPALCGPAGVISLALGGTFTATLG